MKSLGTYFYKIRGLMNLKRYQNLYLFKQRSVAEHSWSVAKIAHALTRIEQRFGNPVDMGVVLQKCLFHDDIELFTGDILSQTKRITSAMKDAVNEAERIAFDEKFSKIIPVEYIDEFRSHLLCAKDGTIEGDILKAADIIDTILESVEEIKLGNTEDFAGILVSVTEKLMESELKSVQFFFKYGLKELGLDIESNYGRKVFEYVTKLQLNDL